MTNGIFESISQGIGREETQENRRIQEIADELRRRCCVYEKEYGTSCSNVNIVLVSCYSDRNYHVYGGSRL